LSSEQEHFVCCIQEIANDLPGTEAQKSPIEDEIDDDVVRNLALEKEKQITEDKRRLAEEARKKAELAVCRRLKLEAKMAAGHFAHRPKAEPTPKRMCPEPTHTGVQEGRVPVDSACHRTIKLEVLRPADFIVDPGLCDREPCRELARNVESRPPASAH
jgi:hypothetical protein